MLRLISRPAFRLLAVLLPLGLGACADTLTDNAPVPSSSTLLRDYENTLSKKEQRAVIGELKADAKAATSVDGAAAKPAEKQE